MVQATLNPAISDRFSSYPESLQRLINSLKKTPELKPNYVKEIVLNAGVLPHELMPWADFNHPTTGSYGRKLIFDGGHFEVMVMSWLPGDFSAIHDHGTAQWGAVQCFGAAKHYIYRVDSGVLRSQKPKHYAPGMVCAVDHSLIHQMGNLGQTPFLSLHVYGCVEASSNITGDARIFDLLEGRIQYTNGGAFFCLPEGDINARGCEIQADRETMLRHHYLMSDRIYRMLKEQPQADLTQKLILLQEKIRQLHAFD